MSIKELLELELLQLKNYRIKLGAYDANAELVARLDALIARIEGVLA